MKNRKFKIVFLFSGQGSHYRGMGQQLYENHPVFRESFQQSDMLYSQLLNRSLAEALYQDMEPDFDELLLTHPAIVAVEIAMLRVVKALGIEPDFVVGASLGEFAAAVGAGIWSAEDALEAAIEQAKAIVRSNSEGGMLAVINASEEPLRPAYEGLGLFLASENFDGHFTLSGTTDKLDAFQAILHQKGYSFQRLAVSHPFHSPLIETAKNDFLYYLSGKTLAPANNFISGLKGALLPSLPGDYFWQAISQPTDFIRLTRFLEHYSPCLYLDLGPSGTSATFMKYNLRQSSSSLALPIMTPFRNEFKQLEALKRLKEEW